MPLSMQMSRQFKQREQSHPLLEKFFKDAATLSLLAKMPFLECDKNDHIYTIDDPADKVYFLLDGAVKLSISGEGGRELTKTIINPGLFFGELALVENEVRRDTATALEPCVIIPFSREKFLSMVLKNPGFGTSVLMGSTDKISRMEKKLESLLFLDTKSRIIAYLIELVESRGERIGYEWVVRNIATHQDIANLTATSRQSVTTALNDLRDAGIITFDRRRLLVRNLDKLRKMVEF